LIPLPETALAPNIIQRRFAIFDVMDARGHGQIFQMAANQFRMVRIILNQ
jgi:hypothetical protein